MESQIVSPNFGKNMPKCLFFLESPTKSVPQENWWFKRVLKMYDCQLQWKIWFDFRSILNHTHIRKNLGKQAETLIFWKKNMQSLKNLGGQTVSPNFGNSWANVFFLLESTTKFVSPENWWFKRVLQNVRLPTSMQDLIWFPEVFRIVFRFERSWESSQEPLKYDLTVENYSRKEKRCAWRIQGTFSFLRLSFSRLDVGKLLYFRLKLKFQSLNLNWQK